MLLKRAEDYRFVVPDADAMEGGAHPFSGDIYPRRSDERKKILSYEDICFLEEACGELYAALGYFSGGGPSHFPFGTYYVRQYSSDLSYGYRTFNVPRRLKGSLVGRDVKNRPYSYVSRADDGVFRAGFPGGASEAEKYMSAVGTDVKKLFTDYMAYSPNTGKTLEDLKGYVIDYYAFGCFITYSYLNSAFFDVFYTLVTLSSSLDPLRTSASMPFDPEGIPPSFGVVGLGYEIKRYGTSTWGGGYMRTWEELAYHDGFTRFNTSGSGMGPGGRIFCAFVSPDFQLPESSDAVMEMIAEPRLGYNWIYPVASRYIAGDMTFSADDMRREDRYVLSFFDHEPMSLQLAYAAYEGALERAVPSMSMGSVKLWPEVDISKIYDSPVPSHDMLATLWDLPGRCRRMFVEYMRQKYVKREGNIQLMDGDRRTYRENGEVRESSGPEEPHQSWTEGFPGSYFSKDIEGEVYLAVSGGESPESYSTSRMNVSAHIPWGNPSDSSVSFTRGDGEGQSAMMAALEGIAKSVDATVLATISHYDVAWVELDGAMQVVRFECNSKTFPIRYRLESPSFNGAELAWMPSKPLMDMIDEMLGHIGMDRGSVFPDSYLTQDGPLPDPASDGRMPEVTVTPGHYAYAHFREMVDVRFDLSTGSLPLYDGNPFWYNGEEVHFGFAEISPRTADQS